MMGMFFCYCENALVNKISPLVDPTDTQAQRKLTSLQGDFLPLAMRLSTTLTSISEAFVTLDLTGTFTYLNQESERLLRRSAKDLLGKQIWVEFGETVGELINSNVAQAIASNRHVEFEAYFASISIWLEVRIHPFEEGLAVYFRDVSTRKATEEKIHHLAFYDTLTELPNRQLLLERLERVLLHVDMTQQLAALMFIDLDNFKTLNDTLGHLKGDLLLQKVAARLQSCVRQQDTVARLGGDEFVVLLQSLGLQPEAALGKARIVANKVLAVLREPYDLAGFEHHSTCSIGVTTFGGQQCSVSDLLKQADLAMYQSKSLGRNTVCFFDPQMQTLATANAALTADLRTALQQQQFVVFYQPQFDRSRRMVAVEALLRWPHPQRGMVSPSEFIPAAEETGLILPLGQWVLLQACQQLAAWALRPETVHLSIAVNVSVRQFRHPDFVDSVVTAIQSSGCRADCLKLELTESLLAESMDSAVAKMNTLKALGVTLALDDFGMGYSSLSYLHRLPLTQLKIDKTFVADVCSNPNTAAISHAIIVMAQSLGLAAMAEGVETEAQWHFLADQGCGYFQGFLLCPPLPLDELESFMHNHRATAAL
jgi:diguanylate cyclase (GGDEF)-like protein/PAS domain S-box-containing protein